MAKRPASKITDPGNRSRNTSGWGAGGREGLLVSSVKKCGSLSDPFKNERRSGFDGFTIQIPPLCSIHFGPQVRMQVSVEVIFEDGGQRDNRNAVRSTKAPVAPWEHRSRDWVLRGTRATSHLQLCFTKKRKPLVFINLHTASSITNPSS